MRIQNGQQKRLCVSQKRYWNIIYQLKFIEKQEESDVLKYWKATEFRSFLMYTGIVVLKDYLSVEVYHHFLLLFCAVTVCETPTLVKLLPMAKNMLEEFVEVFREIYGEAYMTSNVHNLVHLVDEVSRFGELQSFSSYPFESMLGTTKKMLRSGTNPLAQVAKRMTEMETNGNQKNKIYTIQTK